MKKRCLVGLLLVLAVLLCACGSTFGVKRSIGESERYSVREISGAMDAVESHFRRHFDGCTLIELCYDEAFSDKHGEGYAERYKAADVIVLTSSFSVDASGGDGSLNPNYTYTRWQWILTRSKIGGWTLRDWGY
ncbi:MAG: hypothetical protein IJZ02_00740 [Clostridia bacterium]|nr:hypothetical protein [Clostridia bacterium]